MKRIFKYILSLGLLCVLCYLYQSHLKHITPTELAAFIRSYGYYAPLIYIILFTFVPLTLFPDAVLAIAAGLIFGPILGGIYTMIGALSGGTLAYFIARFAGDRLLTSPHLGSQGLLKKIREKGFAIILLLRLIPLIPFDVISYSSGVARVAYKSFISATLLGIIPGVLLLVNIGAGMNEMNSPRLYIATAAFVLLMVGSHRLKSKLLPE